MKKFKIGDKIEIVKSTEVDGWKGFNEGDKARVEDIDRKGVWIKCSPDIGDLYYMRNSQVKLTIN